eukprot:7730004-Karenia_brevis.AAC.1
MEQDERMERLADRVANEGVAEDDLDFLVRVEHLLPQYREQYAEYVHANQDRDVGPLGPIRFWAHDVIGSLDPS